MRVSLVVAMDDNGVIGRDNALPWHMPADLKHFKSVTMGKPIVMGRKTHESIGRVLPGRDNIVISRNPDFTGVAPARVLPSWEAVLALDLPEVMVIGGATLYAQALEQAHCIYLTRIHHAFDGDTVFPAWDTAAWQTHACQRFEADEHNPYAYSFSELSRTHAPCSQ